MDEVERGLLETLLDMYLEDLSSMINEYIPINEFINRPGELTQIGKLWLDGFTMGLFLGIRSIRGSETSVSEQDLETISRMVENRESEIVARLLR
jgi:hypothetical protein